MKFKLLPWLALVPVAAAADTPSTPPAPPAEAAPAAGETTEVAPAQLIGQIADGRYYSANGAFSCPIPMMQGADAIIMDTAQIVAFRDNVSTFLKVAGYPIPAVEKRVLETAGPKDCLVKFFSETMLPEFARAYPGTAAEKATFLREVQGGALIVVMTIPGGSAFYTDAAAPSGPEAPKPVAKYGHLLFVKNGYIYVVSTEIAERVTQLTTYKLEAAAENQLLRDRLLQVLENLQFEAPKAPATAPAAKP